MLFWSTFWTAPVTVRREALSDEPEPLLLALAELSPAEPLRPFWP